MATTCSLYQIECSDQPLDLSFHPHKETLVAAGLVDGSLEVHDFQSILSEANESTNYTNDNEDGSDEEDDTILSSTPVHQQLVPSNTRNLHGNNNNNNGGGSDNSGGPALKQASCRAVWFSNTNHSRLYTGGSAGDLCCVDAEIVSAFSTTSTTDKRSILWRIDQASSSVGAKSSQNNNPIHCLHQLPSYSASGSLIVTGDDRGGVRLWDERLCDPTNPKHNQQKKADNNNKNLLQLPRGCVLSWKESKDYISAFDHSSDGNTLLATSADGTLSVFDLRKASTSNILQNQEAVRVSDHQDDELLAIAVMKNGKKVVCGTTEGVLNVWSWGTWGDVSDRFPNAHEGNSIDAVLKVDENTLLTGSSDGLLRVVSIHPDRFLGVLGGHDGFPIETLKYTSSRKYVGSLSHDQYIRLWDTRRLFDDGENDSDKNGLAQAKELSPREAPVVASSSTTGRSKGGQASDDEWEDMDGEDEMEDAATEDDGDNSNDSDSDDNVNSNNNDSDGSGSDDDEKMPSQNDIRANKLKSKNEEFFADL